MTGSAPEWVIQATGGGPVSGSLALAQLAEAGQLGSAGFTLTSPAFRTGDELDPSFTACEEDAAAPPLEWSAPPPGTHELALVAQDIGDGRVHWAVWGLAAQRGKLLEGEIPPRTGKNALGNSEWLLPDPPVGEERRYAFQLFALDLPLTLMPGAPFAELMRAMKTHVIAAAVLHARFEGHETEAWGGEEFDD